VKTIWKYPLRMEDEQTVKMPIGAEIISVLLQRDILVLYAMVDSDAPLVSGKVYIRGTGHPLNMVDVRHVGSVAMLDRDLVWHVFV